MFQRNPTDHPLDVPDIPATVQPGETVDWPRPIAGFEPADPAPEPEQPAVDVPTAKTSNRKRAGSPAAEEE